MGINAGPTIVASLGLALAVGCGEPPGTGPSSTSDTSGSAGDTTGGDDGPVPICVPGTQQCGALGIETCADTGLEWASEDCPNYASCKPCSPGDDDPLCEGLTARCEGPCDVTARIPSSEGCSFVATRLYAKETTSVGDDPPVPVEHTLVIGNADPEGREATIRFFFTPEGTRDEEERTDELTQSNLPAGETIQIPINADAIASDTSLLRTGGVYRVASDLPVVAYMFSPESPRPARNNDSSLLLPEETFRTDFVVTSYHAVTGPASPKASSYFSIIALEDDTVVQWTPPVETFGNGLPIPTVPAGGTGQVYLNRFDNVRIATASLDGVCETNNTVECEVDADCPDMGENCLSWSNTRGPGPDLSGTVISASKPIAVFGASHCSRVPWTAFTCDHLQEQLLPLHYWGRTYVGARPPIREAQPIPAAQPEPFEKYHWRVYAGADDVTITTTPPVPDPQFTNGVITLAARGDFVEFTVPFDIGSVVFESAEKPFMPVQYLQSGNGSNAAVLENLLVNGDPAMVQMVPTEQWMDRYSFVTGVDWEEEYAQVMRPAGGPDVIVDGTTVTGWVTVGSYEFADWLLDSSFRSHGASSTQDFGLIQYGLNGRVVDLELHPMGNSRAGEPCTTDADCPGTSETPLTCDPTSLACEFTYAPCAVDTDCTVDQAVLCDTSVGRCAEASNDDLNASYAHPGGIRAEVINIP